MDSPSAARRAGRVARETRRVGSLRVMRLAFEWRIDPTRHASRDTLPALCAAEGGKWMDELIGKTAYEIVELQRTGRVALPKLERQAPRLHSVKGA